MFSRTFRIRSDGANNFNFFTVIVVKGIFSSVASQEYVWGSNSTKTS